ncbi:LysR family transcriptional regulator [Bacillus sp. FJAT-27264]|uniref:LysR family transcriptional regulator n=1 Tax=Paenibacillus sp. (strain DSM 101736 / FJAT-27264) TaxID=1850362 RepID=UPI000807C0BE|nr:LysR family transcriptional regulator [Bacillus sp. FJAT-27264]OBZ16137.1 LysR family transcriptional regulator [Bacillus sp. FJAT-27264]
MYIENIEVFVYINHYGSFNKAAEALFISQPTVTTRIRSLERELGCQLFNRIGKQITLTDKGRQFMPFAQQLVETYQKGRQRLLSKNTIPKEIRIGSTISVSNYRMAPILVHLTERFPHIMFNLTTGSTQVLIDKLMAKEIDLAFVRKVAIPAVYSYRFLDDPINLYVYADHPLANAGQVSIQDISHESLVFFECGSLDWERIHRVFDSLEHPPKIKFTVDNSETAKKLILNKVGIAFLPATCAEKEVEEGKLVPIEIVETAGVSVQTDLITVDGNHLNIIEALLELNTNCNE